jgi:myo-inositol-1(or 4)-monophosphatase
MAAKSPLINVMERAARKAGRGLVRDFGEVEQLQVSPKGPGDFVSSADLKAETVLKEELGRARPDFGFLMEESGETPGRDDTQRWIVDPLDGTVNFLHGIPHFCISIAVEQVNHSAGRARRDVIAGLVYNPLTDESYWADKNQGAYLNDRRMRVSGRRRLDEALISIGLPGLGVDDHEAALARIAALMAKAGGVRRLGCAALDLAFVAAGRYEGYWQENLGPWDLAAGLILVREAGGFVCELGGGDDVLGSGSVIAGNDPIHSALRAILEAEEYAAT